MRGKILYTVILFLLLTIEAQSQVNVLHMEQLTYRDGLPHNSVQTIKQDKYGFIWFSSFAGLSRYDGYHFVEYLPDPDNLRSVYTKSVYHMVLDSAQNLWIAFFDTSQFCMYSYPTNDFIRVNSSEVPRYIKDSSNRRNIISNIAERDNEKWELKGKMLLRTNKTTGEIKPYYLNSGQIDQFDEARVRSMFIDTFGTLWIGTEDRGVFKVNIYTKPFYSFFYEEKGTIKLLNNIVRAIHQDKNNHLYIGTQYDGLYVLDRTTNQLKTIGGEGSPDFSRLRSNQIRCIFEDHLGHLWIGSKGGVSEYFPETGRIRNYNRFGNVNIPHNWAYAVAEDQQGSVWVGTFGGGIARYDRDNDRFIHIDPYATLANSRVYCLIIDRNNHLWVGTHGGGVSWLKRTGKEDEFECIHFLNEPGNPNSISSNRVFNLFEDVDGDIWVATDYGLNKIDPENGEIKRFFHKDGLSDDIVFSVTQDNMGNLWMANQKGISKFDVKKGVFSHFNEKDGLHGNEMSENTVFKNKKTGEIFFGGLSGMISFFPEQIKENHILPKVVLTRLEVLNQEVLPGQQINKRVLLEQHISLTNKITFDNSHKSFTIEFAALHFTNPMGNEYQYKLENYDPDWISTSADRRYATYTNLNAGKYIFRVKASNDDGQWSPEERMLEITVRPPWWFSVWAFIAYIVMISAASYFSVLYIMAKIKMKNEVRYEKMKARKMHELNQMKEQFFTKVSHELRTPLSLLIDPLRKMNAKGVDPSEQEYYIHIMYQNALRLAKLVNELLDFRKIESNEFSLKLQTGELVAFLESIVNTFKLNAKEREIELLFRASHQHIKAQFDKDALEKIVFNLLSNAIKYNYRGGQVSLEVKLIQQEEQGKKVVELCVSDNGRGISTEALDKIFNLYYQEGNKEELYIEGSGIGLSLTRELVHLHHGIIEAKSEPGKGSEFRVLLPIAFEAEGNPREELYQPALDRVLDVADLIDTDQDENHDEERFKVLVVEDNDDVRSYIRKDLGHLFEVMEAENGKSGWEKTLSHLPDLILTDLMMPEMDGYELCRKVKTDKQTSHIPVIVLTALTTEKANLEAIESGADAYVSKPFSSSLLRAQIRNLIQSRKSLIDTFGKLPFIDIKKMADNSVDEAFLKNAIEFIEENISEPEFNIDLLSDKLSISRRHLSHKIKTLTGQTVNEFVKTVRLNKGAEMMLNTDQTISEIAYQLGYTAPANFSRSFSKQFGKTPTDYIASITEAVK